MKAAFHIEKMKMVIRDIPMPEPDTNQYLVKVEACAICGSDVWWAKDTVENEPVHGHETVGTIVKTGGTGKFKVGERVVCGAVLGCGKCPDCAAGRPASCRQQRYIQHGFQEYGVYEEALLFKCPGDYDPVSASLLSDTVCTPLHGLRRLPPEKTDTVCVWGLGPLGELHVIFMKALGIENIIGLDPLPERRAAAVSAGAKYAFDPQDESFHKLLFERTNGFGADKAYIYVRNPIATQQAFHAVRSGGALCTFAGLNGEYCLREFVERTLVWSYYFTPAEYYENLTFLQKYKINPRQIVSHTFPLDSIQDAFEMRFAHPESSNKIVITME